MDMHFFRKSLLVLALTASGVGYAQTTTTTNIGNPQTPGVVDTNSVPTPNINPGYPSTTSSVNSEANPASTDTSGTIGTTTTTTVSPSSTGSDTNINSAGMPASPPPAFVGPTTQSTSTTQQNQYANPSPEQNHQTSTGQVNTSNFNATPSQTLAAPVNNNPPFTGSSGNPGANRIDTGNPLPAGPTGTSSGSNGY